jgi:hypothetical protein
MHAKFGKIHAVLVTIIYGEMLQGQQKTPTYS